MFSRLCLAALAVFVFCGEAAAQSREQAVSTLRQFLGALRSRDYERAAGFVHAPPGSPVEAEELAKLVANREISKEGIDILSLHGRWERLDSVLFFRPFPPRAKEIAARAGVPIARGYWLALDGAEAGFYWTGDRFEIIRCDDIGMLGRLSARRSLQLGPPPPTIVEKWVGLSRGVVAVARDVRRLNIEFVGESSGCVIAQTPAPGTSLPPGKGVVLTIGRCGPLP